MGPANLILADYQQRFLRELISDRYSLPRTSISPIRRRHVDDVMFVVSDAGHDPYNHHGRFMHGFPQPFTITGRRIELVWLDDADTPVCDPYNHHGRYA